MFAVWCVRQIEYLITDTQALNAINIAEKFALGDASDQQLNRAWVDAWCASMRISRNTVINPNNAICRDATWVCTRVAAKSAIDGTWLTVNDVIRLQHRLGRDHDVVMKQLTTKFIEMFSQE